MTPRARSRPIPVLALVLAVLGIQLTAIPLYNPLGVYDEGLLVTDAYLIQRGQVPYRDFYSNYPPGSALLARACAFFARGSTIYAMRMLALGMRVAGAALAAILVGRLTGGRARVATFAAILLLQSRIDLTLFAYVTAVTLALASAVALPGDTSKRDRFAVSGVLFGMVSWFRHDLFVYATFVASVLVVVARIARRPLLAPLPSAGRRAFAAGVLATVLPFWGPLLLVAGPRQVLHDLVLDQAKYIQPARVLPVPSFHGDKSVGLFNWTVPAYLTDFMMLGLLALGCGAAAGAVYFVVHLRRTRIREHRRVLAAYLLAIVIATAPQALQRTDATHVGYGTPATLACLFGVLGGVPAFSEILLLVAFLPFAFNKPEPVAPGELFVRLKKHVDDDYIPRERRELREAIHRVAGPNDRIFVGCKSHTRLIIDYVSVYYEARRLGSTRIMQFDPGVVTRDDVQQHMIDELRANHPAAVVLTDGCLWDEPNASKNAGSDRLDKYLDAQYVTAEQVGGFRVMRPR